jgi:hypothetical protein
MPSKSSKTRTAGARILPIVGALIIFLTYMIHDVLRDNLKDKAGALSHAQDQYQFMVISTINIKNQIYFAQALDNETRGKKDSFSNTAFLDASVARVDAQFQLMAWSPLIKQMPNYRNIYQPKIDEIVTMKAQVDEMTAKRASDDKAGKRSEVSDNELEKSANELKSKVEGINVGLTWDGLQSLERAEQDYSFYNTFSIALYVIGWSMGFVGIILGRGKLAGSE